MKQTFHCWLILVVLAGIAGCSTTPGPNARWIGYTEKGGASFYADKHQYRKTASGERYSHNSRTAAHRTIPFGTKINVTNLANGRSVVATVNDRGPFVRGRIVDLSKAAFASIAELSAGVVQVQIEVIE